MSAFSLIELLIVLTILGILAALIIPKFGNAAGDARENALKIQVREIRQQIELYKGQHGGQLPDLVTNWNALTSTSLYKGRSMGPYLPLAPRNSLNDLTIVTDGDGTAAAASACGFVYDYKGGTGSGQIWVTEADGVTLRPTD